MKQYLLIGYMLLGSMYQGFAQPENESIPPSWNDEFRITIGYTHGYFKDLNFSPLNYHHNGISLGIGYRRVLTNEALIQTSLQLGYDILVTEVFRGFNPNILTGTLALSYLHPLFSTDVVSVYAGPRLRSHNDFILLNGLSSFSFLFNHSLGAEVLVSWDINKQHRVESSLAAPLVSLHVRPPFSAFNKEIEANQSRPLKLLTDGTVASPGQYQSFGWQTQYRYRFNDKTDFTAQYAVKLDRTVELQPLLHFQNQLSFGIIRKF